LQNFKGGDGKPTGRWEDNIKVDTCELGCENVKWFEVA